ncbi:MAG: 3-dehydroquinate synthase family protein, partial [Candidatus Avispirillum sp.]
MTTIRMDLGGRGYDILVGSGVLEDFCHSADLGRKVLILTDDGVPRCYAETVAKSCAEPYIYTVPSGEGSKSIAVFKAVLEFMLEKGFSRSDCAVAVGGGVCGDLCGFCAASYMRGIDFYNVPTTVLSQVDSSVGGKTAVNLDTVKNIVGAFWQPRLVAADT